MFSTSSLIKSDLLVDDDAEDTVSSLGHDLESCAAGQNEEICFLTKLHNLDFIGRENELNALIDLLKETAANTPGRSKGMIISGESGQGKSRLVEMIRIHTALHQGYFIHGKFEVDGSKSPFCGIAGAFSDLIDLLCQRDDKDEIAGKLEKALGVECCILENMVSNLPFLIDNYQSSTADSQQNSSAAVWSKSFVRLKQLCGIFLKTIVTHCPSNPIVMVLDDVQWADAESLEMLESLAASCEDTPVLHMWTYRLEENNQPLLDKLLTQQKSFTHLQLGPFEVEDVNAMIVQVTGILEPESTLELASAIVEKTNGNIVSSKTQVTRSVYFLAFPLISFI